MVRPQGRLQRGGRGVIAPPMKMLGGALPPQSQRYIHTENAHWSQPTCMYRYNGAPSPPQPWTPGAAPGTHLDEKAITSWYWWSIYNLELILRVQNLAKNLNSLKLVFNKYYNYVATWNHNLGGSTVASYTVRTQKVSHCIVLFIISHLWCSCTVPSRSWWARFVTITHCMHVDIIMLIILYPVSHSTALTAGVTLGVVGAVLLISLAVLGMCMLPWCPLRKAYSPYQAVRTDEESGRRSIATVPQLQQHWPIPKKSYYIVYTLMSLFFSGYLFYS